ncbi:very short patch repair endonuclease [Ornithinimicrobium sp. INDO-MA30-4]|uniref:very short patch repair endonuclease n=1 Tax=Ornithinimicrobium sp. INDO-MA30-4 TaxID=2908651 RepID=UPI001F4315AF|nr:very short patch repair endonuclease [Ornithinimicrobium sp. INDO-MA30-4]UJH71741.1 very short patch repair endonuclease [Ornithinimicrobium sp. INDO-MA30-4]
MAIRRLLHRSGLRFRLQVRPDPLMRQRIDIAFMTEKVAVDIRGCFWHRCATHGTKPKANADRWADKLDRNVARDQHTVQRLTELGWDVIVVWEHEDPKEASERIRNAILARRAGLKATTTERAVP